MRKWLLCFLSAGGMLTGAQASQVEYGGHYYEFIKTYGTWDTVNAAANASTIVIEGTTYAGHLWTLSSQDEYTSVRSNLGFGGAWELAWVGARSVEGTFTWVNGEGTVDFTGWPDMWYRSDDPKSSNYGVSIGGSGYSYQLLTWPVGDSMQYVIEYEPVPEPTGLALIAVGFAAMAMKRRKMRR